MTSYILEYGYRYTYLHRARQTEAQNFHIRRDVDVLLGSFKVMRCLTTVFDRGGKIRVMKELSYIWFCWVCQLPRFLPVRHHQFSISCCMTSQHTIGTCFCPCVSTIYPHGLPVPLHSQVNRAFWYVRHLQPVFSTWIWIYVVETSGFFMPSKTEVKRSSEPACCSWGPSFFISAPRNISGIVKFSLWIFSGFH